MQFGKVDINPKVGDFTWKEFLDFYEHSLKGNVTETPEEIAQALGVKVPKVKLKGGNA
ncbi:MAG: hypothetical protein IMZ64_11820 [Bacteroidetes bacterium]|nr:hypothetical protein [Bacteroidota bacterium]